MCKDFKLSMIMKTGVTQNLLGGLMEPSAEQNVLSGKKETLQNLPIASQAVLLKDAIHCPAFDSNL